MNWMDDYELRARIIPSAIIISPVIIPIYIISEKEMSSLTSFLFSGIMFIALLYVISFFVRKKGVNIQRQLWKRWNGAPSTRILRWHDSTIPEESKKQLHEAVKLYCGLDLYSRDEEQRNPTEADMKIDQAFLQVKSLVYHDDPNGKWAKYNAEYGFNRNLLGCKMYWIYSTVLGVVLCGIGWHFSKEIHFVYGVIIESVFFLLAVICGGYVLPGAIKDPAENYAISIWQSFLVVIRKQNQKSIN